MKTITDKELQRLMETVRKAFPNATVDEDLEGQLVIYTDVQVSNKHARKALGEVES